MADDFSATGRGAVAKAAAGRAGRRMGDRLLRAAAAWSKDGGGFLAAAVAYAAGLSFFPAMLVLLSVVTFGVRAAGGFEDARGVIHEYLSEQFSEGFADQTDQILVLTEGQAAASGAVSWGVLLFSAGLLFAQFTAAFDRIWNVEIDPDQTWLQTSVWFLKQRGFAFVMLILLGLVAVLVAVVGVVLEAASRLLPLAPAFWTAAARLTSVATNTLVLALLFKWLPPRWVSWRGAVRGGLLGAVLWELGRWVLSSYLIGGRYTDAYDVVGSFIALMLWVYYAACVVFFAAEFVQAHEEDRLVSMAVPAATPDPPNAAEKLLRN